MKLKCKDLSVIIITETCQYFNSQHYIQVFIVHTIDNRFLQCYHTGQAFVILLAFMPAQQFFDLAGQKARNFTGNIT